MLRQGRERKDDPGRAWVREGSAVMANEPKTGCGDRGFLKFCRVTLTWLCIVLFVGMAAMNLLYTGWTDSTQGISAQEFIDLRRDSLLLFLPAAVGLLWLFRRARRAADPIQTRDLARRICWFLFFVGAIWALLVDMPPRADQSAVLELSVQWLNGDLSSYDLGNYLYNFPYQSGIVALLALCGRLLGVGKYMPIQILNAGLLALTFWGLYRIAALLLPRDSDDGRSVLLLSLGAWCGLMYSTFVYGNVPSLVLAVLGLWMQLHWQMEGGKLRWLVGSGICLGYSVLFKSFSLIFVMAQAILLVLHLIRTRDKRVLAWLLAVLLAWQGSNALLNGWVSRHYGGELNDGAPMVGTIAMGLQPNEVGWRAPGWYNGYNINVYKGAGYDRAEASRQAKDYIRGRVREFAHDPGMAWAFFRDKTLSQWAEPTYQGFWIACSGNRPLWLEKLFVGPINTVLVWLMNWYQSLIWVCAAVWIIARRRTATLEQLLPGLVILGGFLFQLFWEGKGQYTLTYFLLALPYAAAGIQLLLGLGQKKSPQGGGHGGQAAEQPEYSVELNPARSGKIRRVNHRT